MLKRKCGKGLRIKQSSRLRTLLAATVPKVGSTFLSTLRSNSTAGRVFSLGRVRRHGIGRGQRDLAPFDLQHGIVSPSIQVPVFLLGQDGVHSWHFHAVQLPFSIWECDIHGRWQAVVVLPDPGMDTADASLQQVLWPVQVLCQGHLHSNGQGQHAAKISGITVMVLEPPVREEFQTIDMYTWVLAIFLWHLVCRTRLIIKQLK